MKKKRFKKILAIFGGGGLRGIAHAGVLKALHELDLYPDEFCGTSVGSIIAGCAASGLEVSEIEDLAINIKKSDIMDFNLKGILTKGLGVNSLHSNDALKTFVEKTIPYSKFKDLKYPLYINTVNINTGGNVVWGLNSMISAPIHQTILASCSIPGVFPPVKIGRHYYVDGAVVNNLMLRVGRAIKADLVIAVNLKNLGSFSDFPRVENENLLTIIDRADNITSQMVFNANLSRAKEVPLVFLQPEVSKRDIFDFNNIKSVFDEGYNCAMKNIPKHPLILGKKSINPLRPLYQVQTDICKGCGFCEMNCDGDLWSMIKGKAVYDAKKRKQCGGSMTCLRNCPYNAITLLEEGNTL